MADTDGGRPGYKAVLSPEGRRDLRLALKRSQKKFGEDAAFRYRRLIGQAVRDIEGDPFRPGSSDEKGARAGMRSYHVSFSRQRARTARGIVQNPRHLIVYQIRDECTILVLRILHDQQDLQQQLAEEEE